MMKLKNLWKIALATMAMTAMLVSCDTKDDNGTTEDDPNAKYKTTPVTDKAESFAFGFKFSTEEGWAVQYISEGAVKRGVQADKVYLPLNGDAKKVATTSIDKATGDLKNDDTTKLWVDSKALTAKKLYTIEYNKKTGDVKLRDAATGETATSTEAQEAGALGNYPEGIYISGYLGSNWAGDANADKALLMDVIDKTAETYKFTWIAPATTITVTLKIDMEETVDNTTTKSTLYLRDVPVKNDGTSEINGSIYGWNDGTAVIIKNDDDPEITGGIYDAKQTATSNATWALENFKKGEHEESGKKVANDLTSFGVTGCDDVLQLSIDKEAFVPYVKGSETIFSWKNRI